MTTLAGGSEGEGARGQGVGVGESETTAKYRRRPTIRMKPVAPPRAGRTAPRASGATRAVLTLVIEDDASESPHALRASGEHGRSEDSVVGFWQPSNASFTIVVAASVALAVTALVTMLVLARTNAELSAGAPSEVTSVAPVNEGVAQAPERAAAAASVEPPPPAIPVVDVMSLPAAPPRDPDAR